MQDELWHDKRGYPSCCVKFLSCQILAISTQQEGISLSSRWALAILTWREGISLLSRQVLAISMQQEEKSLLSHWALAIMTRQHQEKPFLPQETLLNLPIPWDALGHPRHSRHKRCLERQVHMWTHFPRHLKASQGTFKALSGHSQTLIKKAL